MRNTSPLPSLVQKHSVLIDGARTSISLESAFWRALKHLAAERSMSLGELVSEIGPAAGRGNLSSAIRVHLLNYYQQKADQIARDRRP
ncbi:ribbon-helix-helix domain-containing protein [Tardiphaga sp. 862_B3_N4_1]|jgi:predicted DNA-binding ribbon-helix-helix protein|uniref:ribbon-helix-helix domain-containing protein n=1 Tax=Tardiphaga sp. 862_B3_N4_1 TaxID=3240764 RepID=UPI003F27C9FC